MRSLTTAAFLVFAFVLSDVPSSAQQAVDVSTSTGAPQTIYHGTDIDNVNLSSGNLRITVPLLHLKGRGIDTDIVLTYNSKIWQSFMQPDQEGFQPQVDTLLNGDENGEPSTGWGIGVPRMNVHYGNSWMICTASSGGNCLGGYDFYDLVTNDGTVTTLITETVNGPNYWSFDGSYVRSDGAGYRFKDGSKIVYSGYPSFQSTLEDTNGNTITCVPASCTDTLGRVISFNTNPSTGLLETITYYDSSDQQPQTISFSYQTNTLFYPWADDPASCEGSGTCYSSQRLTEPLLTEVTLANGRSYQFEYESNGDGTTTGEVTKLILPVGGYMKYTYGWAHELPPIDADSLHGERRAVATRTVSSDGTQASEKTWTYSVQNTNCMQPYQNAFSTVIDPLGNQQVQTQVPGAPLPSEIQYYDSHSTLLKAIQQTVGFDSSSYATGGGTGVVGCNGGPVPDNPRITASTTTLNDTGQVSREEMDYGTEGNVTAHREYDWGSGSWGSLIRTSSYTYLQNSNSSYDARTVHILDRVLTRTICNSGSTFCSSLSNTYDATSPSQTSSVTQHDYTNYPYTYNFRGNLTETDNWASSANQWMRTHHTYNDLGGMLSTTDPNTNVTTYSYTDNFYNYTPSASTLAYVTQVTYPTTSGYAHIERTQYYFNSGLPSASCGQNFPGGTNCQFGYTPPQPDYETYAYDALNRLLVATAGDGGQTGLQYIEPTNPSSTNPFETTSTAVINSSQNLVRTLAYDGLGRTMQTQVNSDTEGVDFVDTTYDADGRTASVTNPHRSTGSPTDGTTGYAYDGLGRIKIQTQADGSTVSYSYSGNCTTVTDEVGNDRKSCTDGLGRLTQLFENPSGYNYETDYTYDVLDNLTQVVQKGGSSNSSQWRTRTFTYDSLSRLLCANNTEIGTAACPNPDNGSYTAGTIRYAYDNNGNVLSKISPAPNQTVSTTTVTLNYSYDALNRLLQKTSNDGTIGSYYLYDVSNTNGVVLQYPIGRLSRSNTSVVESLHSYDPTGRIIYDWQTTPMHNQIAFGLGYTYDYIGDMTSYSNGMGYSFWQAFDNVGRVSQVTTNYTNSPSTIAQAFTYAPTGAMTTVNFGTNDMVGETRTYNSRLQPTTIQTYTNITSPASSVQNNWMLYTDSNNHNNGNVYLWDFYSAYGSGIGASPRTYAYDKLNRLTSMSSPNDTSGCLGLTWSYDPWGNRDQNTTSGTGGSCPNFNPTFSQNTNRMDNYSYDAAGNLLNDGNHTYTYDAENHITQVDAGSTGSYVYDADGRRVEANNSEGTMEKIYDLSGNVIAEWKATGQMQGGWWVGYVYFLNRLAALYEGSTTYFVGTDHLGSGRGIADTGGHIVDATNVLPFGEQLQGDTYTSHKFTGKERDSESGLDNFGARYDSSQYGRFMSPDPIGILSGQTGDPQSLNLYSYVQNNPLNATDPDGLDCVYVGDNSVSVQRGDCTSDTDSGIFINGTINTNSFTYNSQTQSLGFNYTNDDTGALGAGVIGGVAPSGGVSSDDLFNAVAQGTQMAAPGVNLAANGLRAFGYVVAAPLMAAAECAAGAPSCTKGNVAMAIVPILIPESSLAHVLEGHSAAGAATAGKSVFNAGEDIKGLIQAAESAPAKSAGDVLIRTVDAGRAVGIDRSTGQITSVYTVITKNTGELITAYPGRP